MKHDPRSNRAASSRRYSRGTRALRCVLPGETDRKIDSDDETRLRVRPSAEIVADIDHLLGSGSVQLVGAGQQANESGSNSNGCSRMKRRHRSRPNRLSPRRMKSLLMRWTMRKCWSEQLHHCSHPPPGALYSATRSTTPPAR